MVELRTAPAAGQGDSAVVVEGLSKRYPRKRVILFPPTTSIFERRWFGRRRNAAEDATTTTDRSGPRSRRRDEDLDVDDDVSFDFDIDDGLDDEDDDDGDDGYELASGGDPARPGEMFWALRDISFRVRHGEALGILGPPGAGKTTLLGILAGQVQATEGRACVHDPISPLPSAVATALSASGKGDGPYELIPACRLLGFDPRPIKEHLAEIEELAAPLFTADGERERGSLVRLSVATAVIVPSNVVLVEEPPGVDEGFMLKVAERLRERLRAGATVLFASRQARLAHALCDDVLALSGGVVVDRGDAKSVASRYEGAKPGVRRGESQTIAPGRYLSEGRELRIPGTVAAFNASAAIISGILRSGRGREKRIDATEEVFIEIVLETAIRDVEVHLGVTFMPLDEREHGIRLELPEPLCFAASAPYRLVARTQSGALFAGLFSVRADAIVANPAERDATVIAREIGRVEIIGDQNADTALTSAPIEHWDGFTHQRAEAAWSSSLMHGRPSSRKARKSSS